MFLGHDSQLMPSFVIESGWTESILPRLHSDIHLWLVGGQPAVQVVIVLRWTKLTPHITGVFEVWERNTEDVPYLKQEGVSDSSNECSKKPDD